MALPRALIPALASVALISCSDMQRCSGQNAISFSVPTVTYYVLIDSSGSYFSHTERAITGVKPLVNLLRVKDRLALAEIQSCSFTEDAELFDEEMPITQRELYARRQPIGLELDRIAGEIKESDKTDIQGAFLGASLAMKSGNSERKVLIVFSDLDEDRSPDCNSALGEEIDLTGIDVLFVEVKRLKKDERDPAGYLARRRFWEDWALAHYARSAQIVNDRGELSARVQALADADEPPERDQPRKAPESGPYTAAAPVPPTASAPAVALPSLDPPPAVINQSSQPELPLPATLRTPPPATTVPGQAPPTTAPTITSPQRVERPTKPPPPINTPPPAYQPPPAAPPPPAIPGIITTPVWIARPSPADLARFYPSRADRTREEGYVELDCVVRSDGTLGCFVAVERPLGLGFGEAARRMVGRFQMASVDRDGYPTQGRRYRLKVPFQRAQR